MTDTRADTDLPQFHIVVKHPNRSGPIGPYRMTLAVAFAMFVAGRELWAALMTGYGYDEALLHAGVAALFIWVISGFVSGILGAGLPPAPPPPSTD